jgi:biopolymer transport protein ExbB
MMTPSRAVVRRIGAGLVLATVLAARGYSAAARADDPVSPRAWAGAISPSPSRQSLRLADASAADAAASADASAGGPVETPPAGERLPSGHAGQAPLLPSGSLLTAVRQGGLLMLPLLGCSFALAVFGIERAVALRGGRVVPGIFVVRFLEQVEAGQLSRDEALDACYENASPIATIFASAVRRWGRPAVEIEQAVIDACERELQHLRRYRRVFHGVATTGPLLGLLGTVFGLMKSFHDVAVAGAMGRPDLLARGFGEALITTAVGLLVAIPAMVLHSAFTSRVDRLAMRFDEAAQTLVDLISAEAASLPRRRGRGLRPGRPQPRPVESRAA